MRKATGCQLRDNVARYIFVLVIFAVGLVVDSAYGALVTSVSPADGSVAAVSNASAVAVFDSPPAALQGVVRSELRGVLPGAPTVVGSVATFDLPGQLSAGERIYCTARDGAAAPHMWGFTGAAILGSGTYRTNATSQIHDAPLFFVRLDSADIDADGLTDLVAAGLDSSNVVVCMNQGAGTFSVSTYGSSTGRFYDVDLVDYDADGDPDMVLGADDTTLVTVTNSAGSFGIAQGATLGGSVDPYRRIVSADFNGDGYPDVATVTEFGRGVLVGINNGVGGYVPGTSLACSNDLYGITAGDLNADGLPDIVAVGANGHVCAATNTGDGTLVLASEENVTGENLYDAALIDLDQDGSLEVAVVGGGGYVAVGPWDAGALDLTVVPARTEWSAMYAVQVADCDGNGLPDLVVCGGDVLDVIFNSDGTNLVNSSSVSQISGESLYDVEAADFDGDGRVDVAVCGLLTGSIYVLYNTSAPTPVVRNLGGAIIGSGEPPSVGKGTDLGDVAYAAVITNFFTIENSGAGLLEMGSVAVTGALPSEVSVTNMPSQLLPGATGTFSVVFSPESVGNYDFGIRIANNAPVSSGANPYQLLFSSTAIKAQVNTLTLSNTNHIYDATAKAVSVVVDPSVVVDVTYDGASAAPTNAAIYEVIATVNDSEYAGSVTGQMTIAKRVLDTSTDDLVRGYGETNPVSSVDYVNFVVGENQGMLVTQAVAQCAAGPLSNAGTYPIIVGGGYDENYDFDYTNGTLTVTQVVLTVSAQNASRPYGQTNGFFALDYAGWRNADDTNDLTVLPVGSSVAGITNGTGTYEITVAGGVDENYSFSYVSGTLTVVRAAQTLLFPNPGDQDATNRVVLSTTASSGLTVTNFDVVSGPANVAWDADTNAYVCTFSAGGTVSLRARQDGNANWLPSEWVTNTFTANRVFTDVEITDTNQVYDGTAREVGVNVAVTGLTMTVTYDGLSFAPTNPGTYIVVVEIDDPIIYANSTGQLHVAQRPLWVGAEDEARVYGATNPAFTVTYTNFAAGEGISNLTSEASASCSATPTSTVGAYPIVPSGATADNYQMIYSNGVLTVTQALVQVSVAGEERAYGDTNPVFSVSYAGWVPPDDETALITPAIASTTADVASVVGMYPITLAGATATNYTFAYSNGWLEVYPAPATSAISNLLHTYDGTQKAVSVTTSPSNMNHIVYYSGVTNLPVDAGSYTVRVEIAEQNYAGTNSAIMSIVRGDQTISSFLPTSGVYSSEELIELSAVGTGSTNPVVFAVVAGSGDIVQTNFFAFGGLGQASVEASLAGDLNWNPAVSLTNWYEPIDTSTVHYVAQAGQTPKWPYTSWGTAASNLQAAVGVAQDDNTVVVGPGVYKDDSIGAPGSGVSNRLVVATRALIMSSDGPATTVIEGDPGSVGDPVRCVYLTNGASIVGFTLRNGGTRSAGNPMADQSGGGVLQFSGSMVSNCVIESCSAVFGGGVRGGIVLGSTLRGNTATLEGGGVHSGRVYNSLIVSNSSQYGGGVFRSTAVGVTVADNSAVFGAGVFEGKTRNTVAYYNGASDILDSDAESTCAGSGVIAGVDGCITSAPLFAARSEGNYRLQHESPCINSGINASAATNGVGTLYADRLGQARILHSTVDMGAYEYNGMPELPVLNAPANVTAHGFDSSWSSPTGTVTTRTFDFDVRRAAGPVSVTSTQLTGTVYSFTQTGLDEETVYEVRVRAQNEYTGTVWSAWQSVTTLTEGAFVELDALAFSAVYAGGNPVSQVVTQRNSGATAYVWSNSTEYAGTGGWLTVSPDSGVVAAGTSAIFTCAVDISGLNAGVYVATNTYTSASATNEPINQAIVLNIQRAAAHISISDTNSVFTGGPQSVTVLVSNNLPVTVSYNGSTNLPVNAGIYAVTAVVDTVNYTGEVTALLAVERAPQSITGFSPVSGLYASSASQNLSATGGGSGYPVTYVVESGPGFVAGNVFRFTGYGPVTVTASQAGDTNWLSASATNTYQALASTNATYYVAQDGQSPVWPYASWVTAASNIQAAVDVAQDGDTVNVAEGEYAAGTHVAGGVSLASRLCVTVQVTVVAVDGYSNTVIRGEQATGGGHGADATRCVYVGPGGVVAGFTLMGGHTTTEDDLLLDRSGGGALVNGGLLSDCLVVSNSASEYGGGLCVLNGGRVENVVAYGNTAAAGGGAIVAGSVLNNSTIADNVAFSRGGVYALNAASIVNCIVYGNTSVTNQQDLGALGANVSYTCAGDGVVAGVNGCTTNQPAFIDAPSGDYRLAGNSPCIDAGNSDVAPVLDLDANSRVDIPSVVNGGIGSPAFTDIGAFERVVRAMAPLLTPVPNVYTNQTLVTFSVIGGATVYYTLDGSVPSSGSASGTNVLVGTTVLVRAIAYVPGMLPSAVTNGLYTITDTDGDGIPDWREDELGTDSDDVDTDDDGVNDGDEIIAGQDPLNPFDNRAYPERDFDGDGISDLVVYDDTGLVGTRGTWLIRMSGGGVETNLFGQGGVIAISGDFDGDGTADQGVFTPDTGRWLVSVGTNVIERYFGYSGTVPVVGDFDGDGIDDYGCYDAAGIPGVVNPGSWYFMGSTRGFFTEHFGYHGTVPVVGDFDGDGIDDYGCYDAAGIPGVVNPGSWYFMGSTRGFFTEHFGYHGTVPVVGDFDGDEVDDFGCYDASGIPDAVDAGSWYFMCSTRGFFRETFGYAGTVPVVGDFDRDLTDDFGCYDAGGIPGAVDPGTWFIMRSRNGFTIIQHGYGGTTPVGSVE